MYVNGPFDYNAMPLAPMGCTVQIYESTNRRTTWAENSIEGWYLRTSPEHYWCHVIHVKKRRSERITDTVWFKHKYITHQPKVTPVDQIVIKGQKQCEGFRTDGSITKPQRATHQEPNPRGRSNTAMSNTFEPSVKPPAPSPRAEITEPDRSRIQLNKKQMSVNNELLGKSIQNHSNRRIVRVPIARVLTRSQCLTTNSQRILRERSQLIHDKETGVYLNYQQLLKDPKHANLWAHSAVNEFG